MSRAPQPQAYARPLALVLELPGGTHYAVRLTHEGTAPLEPLGGEDGLTLVFDGRDHRFSASEPLHRADAEALAAEINPDIEHRLVYLPGSRQVVYARARDEIPEGRACPLLLALELLGAPGLAPRSMMVLVIGPASRPDLAIMLGVDLEGALDPSSLQVWVRPQDPVQELARDYAERNGLRRDGGAPLRTQDDLLALAPRLPHYLRARTWFGRTGHQWAQVLAALSAVAALGGLVADGVQAVAWLGARRDAALAQAERDRQVVNLQAAVDTAPRNLARAASLDYRALVKAAQSVWTTTTIVHAEASAEGSRLVVRAPIPGAGAVAGNAADISTVRAALEHAPPPGYVRGLVKISGDLDAMEVTYQAGPERSAAAELLRR